MTDRMPALYIGHGAPPLLDDPVWSGQLRDLARTFDRPPWSETSTLRALPTVAGSTCS